MSLRNDHHYTGTVSGAHWTTAKTGNVGLTIELECKDGSIAYTLWATPKNRENAIRDFGVLGITEEQLTDANYVDRRLCLDVVGREVTFRCAEEEYMGRVKQKVLGIGGLVSDVANKLAEALNLRDDKFVVSGDDKRPAQDGSTTITDADIPFRFRTTSPDSNWYEAMPPVPTMRIR